MFSPAALQSVLISREYLKDFSGSSNGRGIWFGFSFPVTEATFDLQYVVRKNDSGWTEVCPGSIFWHWERGIQGRRAYENIINEICQMKRYQFTTLIWEEDGVYVSKCMEVELSSCGETPKEALENLREAFDLWLKNAELLGLIWCSSLNNLVEKIHFCHRGWGCVKLPQVSSHTLIKSLNGLVTWMLHSRVRGVTWLFIRMPTAWNCWSLIRNVDPVPIGTLMSIMKQARMERDEFYLFLTSWSDFYLQWMRCYIDTWYIVYILGCLFRWSHQSRLTDRKGAGNAEPIKSQPLIIIVWIWKSSSKKIPKMAVLLSVALPFPAVTPRVRR